MQKAIVVALLLFISFPLFSQQADHKLNDLDIQLSRYCNLRSQHVFSERREEVMTGFESMMLQMASYPGSFHFPFDSLERCIYITFSNDRSLKCYSYDNLEGGSAHTYSNIVSFFNGEGKLVSHNLKTEAESPMVGYFEIHRIKPFDMQKFLFIGYGTYGGGKEHMSIQLFEIQKDSLVECFSCYEDYSPLFFEQNRGQDFEIEYDNDLQQIKAKVYKFDDNTGFFTNEFHILNYSIMEGHIRRRK